MITIVGKIFNWKNQGLKHKSKSSKLKVQCSKDKKSRVKAQIKKFKVQCSKFKGLIVQRIKSSKYKKDSWD